jgi:hypothetical protein
MMAAARDRVAQAWIELTSRDPEAVSALAVARAELEAGEGLEELRRLRVIEVCGPLPARARLEELLHRSTQFYNPNKERCTLRCEAHDPPPVAADSRVVLVTERGGDRLPAAERWWRGETGEKIEAREGVAWVLRFANAASAAGRAADLAVLRDRRHGLLCNPHSQHCRLSGAEVPLPWLEESAHEGEAIV